MWTSTVLAPLSGPPSQTSSRISRLETTSPARRARWSRTANSRGVSATGVPARAQVRAAESTTRSPSTVRCGAREPMRRARALRRATRTRKEKGLERKSSAPVSRASASSHSPSLAVSIRIPASLPAARSREQTR